MSYEGLRKAARDGRVTPSGESDSGRKLYDVDKCRIELAANTDAAHSAAGRQSKGPAGSRVQTGQKNGDGVAGADGVTVTVVPGEGADDEEPSEAVIGTAAEANRQSLWLEVRKKRIVQKRLEGDLLDKGEVSAAWGKLLSGAKSKILAMGDNLSSRLADDPDPISVKEVIDNYSRDILDDLARGVTA